MNNTPTTHTLEAPGAVIAYDVREAANGNGGPPLMMVGSPMDARGFATLAGHFPDRTVITYDPRGVERSRRSDEAKHVTPEQHGDDLHRVIEAVGGPVDLFASSGGAVNALELVARHPEDVRTLVAHEPPLAKVLPDSEAAMAAVRSISDAYESDGFGAGMGRFIALTNMPGPIPADFGDQPAPGAEAFGMPGGDDGSRDDALLSQNLISCTHYEPDFDALRSAPTHVVVAIGAESEGQMAYRGGVGVAERLSIEPTVFPSHHGGYMGGEFGAQGDPDGFAAALRKALAD